MSNPSAPPEAKPSETPQREADCPAPTCLDSLVQTAEKLGWSGIIERTNRQGKTIGYCGHPPGYSGPRINLKPERMRDDYRPMSHCVSYPNDQADRSEP